ncbi:MAG TPA: cytochrome c peroxidase [Polyangiaceae bacterium]
MSERIRKPRLGRVRRAAVIVGAAVAAALLVVRFATPRAAASATQSAPAALAAVLPPAANAEMRENAAPASARRIAVGRAAFFDTNLSEPTGTSCASCHDPSRGFAGNHGSTIGVPLGSRPGHYAQRNTPSVLYLQYVRRLHPHWEEDAPLVDMYGGFFWDGRVDALPELVRQPLLNPDEMNGGDADRVATKVRASVYATEFRAEFGGALDDAQATLNALGDAVAAYLLSPEMSPFTSKYDDYIRGKAKLSPAEARGLALFKDSAKGGCAGCHKLNDTIPVPERSLFTDYGYDAVAAPRNMRIPANADPARFDLGLCKRPDTHYHTDDPQFCGSFRTPSLRNVAVRTAFMHNGYFTKLRDVVSFYASRDTSPRRWYPSGVKFDDVPKPYREYVNVDKAPYNRREGAAPALDDAEIDAVVAFLGTLTDARYR